MMLFQGIVWLSFVQLHVVISKSTSNQHQQCYENCVCFNDVTSVDCSNKKLTTQKVQEIVGQLPANVTKLWLHSNYLNQLMLIDFTTLPQLEELYLSNNFLTSFSDIVMMLKNELQALKILDISYNAIKDISIETSSKSTLEKLFASNNKISILSSKFFSGFTNLKELRMDHNKLSEMPNLQPMRNLQILRLENNNIKHIKENTFKGLDDIYDLDLSNNKIMLVERGALRFFKNATISFASNKLKKLQKGFFQSPNVICSINFENNIIEELDQELFKGIEVTDKINGVNLQKNNIRHIKVDTFINMTSGSVLLYDNPLNCDCNTFKILQTMNDTNVEIKGICSAPARLRNIFLEQFPAEKLQELCPRCLQTNNLTCTQCYSCTCATYDGKCLLTNGTIASCNCSEYILNTNKKTLTKAINSNAFKWILIVMFAIVILLLIIVSLPMHFYCRRRIKKKQLRRLDSFRKQLLSSKRWSSRKSSSNSDLRDTNVEGNDHPHGSTHAEDVGNENNDDDVFVLNDDFHHKEKK